MNKLRRFIFTGKFVVLLLALLQVFLFIAITVRLYTAGAAVCLLLTVPGIIAVLCMARRDDIPPAYKISWLIVMTVLPLSGVMLYILYSGIQQAKGGNKGTDSVSHPYILPADSSCPIIGRVRLTDKSLARQMLYLQRAASALPYENTQVKYYSNGDSYFRDMLKDMEKAEKSIFLQYFIIDRGFVWDSVLQVLKKKVKQGVDVRLIYDGLGCLANFPSGYRKTLRSMGIKVCIFNDMKFSLHIGDYIMLNHRDHRKVTVIDSRIGYSGGVNIADEYVNYKERFGCWKDTGFRLEGQAVESMTAMFLQSWGRSGCNNDSCPAVCRSADVRSDGIVQPYYDIPMDKNNVCANAYLNIINNAKDYLYIATPYLIVDSGVLTALTLAAAAGVDVRIVLPGIPDKWFVYCVTQSYYNSLLKWGVKIYEYTPGFVHAKMYISDDNHAIVGGANTDYRSMYLNYENCCSFYGGSVIRDVKKDFEDMFAVSHLVTESDVKNFSVFRRICRTVFRIIAPFM